MLNLDLILKDAEEFAKVRDSATDGPWSFRDTPDRSYDDGFREYPYIITTTQVTDLPHQGIADIMYQEQRGEDVSHHNAQFIAVAKNYDSPAIIRQLVERVKELEGKIEHARDELIVRYGGIQT